jgi:threonine aldolase
MIRFDVEGPYYETRFAQRLAEANVAAPDSYGEGALIQDCEAALATALGKERAVLFATGTLANMVALDLLCARGRRRVLLHRDSHVQNDTGDSLASVMGLTAIVADAAGPGIDAAAIDKAAAQAKLGKVAQAIGAVCIETPVRRRHYETIPEAQLAETIAAARRHGMALHLDGARLPVAAAAQGKSMAAFAAPFDTVYLSLWKMLGLPFGAVLAGPAHLMALAVQERRRFGGALPQFWPLASVAQLGIVALEADWRKCFAWQAKLGEDLQAIGGPVPQNVGSAPTNALWLRPKHGAAEFWQACRARQIALGDVEGERVLIRINPTVLPHSPGSVARMLMEADS